MASKCSGRRYMSVVALIAACAVALALLPAAAGCGGRFRDRGSSTSTGGGSQERSLEFAGRERTYILHLPESYDAAGRYPLVMALHGGTSNADQTVTLTGMNETADREGFIAVYPNGTGAVPTWNVGFGYGYALRNNVDDVGFLRALVMELEKEFPIDPDRVYATGISNGAMLSYRLASEASDVFAAVAPVAGVTGGRADDGAPLVIFPAPARPVPVMAFNGKADEMVPYDGGKGRGISKVVYLSVPETMALWVDYNGCSSQPVEETSGGGNIIKQVYSGGGGGSEVVLYTILDGTHSWPGGTKLREGGPGPNQQISANDLMWEFFQAHPRSR